MGAALWYINTTWACGGVVTESSGVITETCPIFYKFKHRNIVEVLGELGRKRQLIDSKCHKLEDFGVHLASEKTL